MYIYMYTYVFPNLKTPTLGTKLDRKREERRPSFTLIPVSRWLKNVLMSNCADLMDPGRQHQMWKMCVSKKPFERSGSLKLLVCSHCLLAANLGKQNQALQSCCDKNNCKNLICLLSVNVTQMSCLWSQRSSHSPGLFPCTQHFLLHDSITLCYSPSDWNVLECKKGFWML